MEGLARHLQSMRPITFKCMVLTHSQKASKHPLECRILILIFKIRPTLPIAVNSITFCPVFSHNGPHIFTVLEPLALITTPLFAIDLGVKKVSKDRHVNVKKSPTCLAS